MFCDWINSNVNWIVFCDISSLGFSFGVADLNSEHAQTPGVLTA